MLFVQYVVLPVSITAKEPSPVRKPKRKDSCLERYLGSRDPTKYEVVLFQGRVKEEKIMGAFSWRDPRGVGDLVIGACYSLPLQVLTL